MSPKDDSDVMDIWNNGRWTASSSSTASKKSQAIQLNDEELRRRVIGRNTCVQTDMSLLSLIGAKQTRRSYSQLRARNYHMKAT